MLNRPMISKDRLQQGPIIWLGQSVNTSSICADHPELNHTPFLTSLGCAILRPSLKRTHLNFGLKVKLGISGPLMVDSGGFALMRNPSSKWSIRDVSDLVGAIDAEIFVSLDYPPHMRDTRQDRRRKIIRSAGNFKKLSDLFPTKIIMPVVHGRTSSEIELSIQLIERSARSPKWIGLGGVVPLLQHRAVSREISRVGPEIFIARSIASIRSAFPKARIHIFGAGGTRTFPAVFALGADSADSIGWRQAAGFGSIFLPLKSQRAIKWNDTGPPPRKQLDESDLMQLADCRCPICFRSPSVGATLLLFKSSFHNRSIHNAWTTAHQMNYWPVTRAAMRALVSNGKLGPAWARAATSEI
jgi:queuine/archaeosine tRNA-ribosyltransferase